MRAKYRKLLSQLKKQIKFLKGALRGQESIWHLPGSIKTFGWFRHFVQSHLNWQLVSAAFTEIFIFVIVKFQHYEHAILISWFLGKQKFNNKVDLPALLEDLGFILDHSFPEGYVKLIHPELIIEFLVPEIGRGTSKPYPLPELAMNAQRLSIFRTTGKWYDNCRL